MAPAIASPPRALSVARLLAGAVLLASAFEASAEPLTQNAAAGLPSRIVSLDLCTDQLLIELGDAARIAAITHLARDPALSTIPTKAQGLKTTRGGAEDVLGYDPDLVLAGPFGVSPTVGLLRRLNRNVLIVPLAQDLAGVRRVVRQVASTIGAEGRGEAMIADFDARLARIPASTGPPPTAVVYGIGGEVSGPGSLADAALAAAGFRNMSAGYRLTRSGQVRIEMLITRPPDLLVVASQDEEYRTAVADNLRHPALKTLRARRPVLALPWSYWLCGTLHIADAIERLASVRQSVRALTKEDAR